MQDHLLHLANFFRKEFPEHKFKVKRVSLKDDYGNCLYYKNNDTYIIFLDKNISKDAQILLFVHEFAHVLSYHKDLHPSDHGPIFGIAYARAWRSYIKWYSLPKKVVKQNMIKVVHYKKDPYDIYIGRGSPWGNPFTIGYEMNNSREVVIEKYRDWILEQPDLMNSLHKLVGKRLACYCAPKACHGDVLKELAEKHVQVENGKIVSYDVFCTICCRPFEFIKEGKPCCENGHYLRL